MKEDWIQEGTFPTGTVKTYKAIAHIRCNETKEVIDYLTFVWMDDNGIPNVFNWEKNNYSCDCNREGFFNETKGDEWPDVESPCTKGRFSVNLSNPANGKIFYREYE